MAQAQAELRLGRSAEASRLVDSARQLFVAGGDRNGEARALNRIANIEYEQGDYDEAKRVFREAEKVLRTVGNLRDLATALNNVADTTTTGRRDRCVPDPDLPRAGGVRHRLLARQCRANAELGHRGLLF